MAKRSDFAQKLLDDLRLRKEHMAAAQSSNHSNTTTIDAYAYSKQTYRGSRETKTRATAGSRTGNTYNRPNGGKRAVSMEEASKHIVPFGRGQSSAQIGELSMALAFALDNGGKLRGTDASGNNSMLNFLHLIGRGSMEISKLERRSTVERPQTSSSNFPTISHFHIKEISKGAQKLNQILQACTNGHNFNRYSVEIGKELLKGAIELEESLRMLVNMQEASQYTRSSQRKSRITLLDEDDDNDDDTALTTAQKQLDLPKFSSDKRSRNSAQEVARRGVMQRLAALTYPKGASDSNHEKQALITSNSASHIRKASYGSDVKTLGVFTEHMDRSSSSKSKSEKGRIPSVIVKLMGLDELPENVDPKYTTQENSNSSRVAEKNRDTHSVPQEPVKKGVMQAPKNPVFEDIAAVVQAGKHTGSHYSNFEVALHDRKQPWKNLEGTKSVLSSTENRVQIKQYSNIASPSPNTGRQKGVTEKEGKQDKSRQWRQKDAEKSKSHEPVIKYELQQIAAQKQKTTGNEVKMREKIEHKASRLHVQNQQKPHSHLGIHPPHVQQKSEPQEQKYRVEEKIQWHEKQKMLVRKQKGTEMMSKMLLKPKNYDMNMRKKQQHMIQVKPSQKGHREHIDAMPSKWFQDKRPREDFGRDRYSINLHTSVKGSMKRNSDHKSSINYSASEPNGVPSLEEKVAHVSVTRKAQNVEMHKGNGSLNNKLEPLKQQNSTTQEISERKHEMLGNQKGAKQVRGSTTNEAEAHVTKSNESEASIQPPNTAQKLQRENDQASTLYSPTVDECPSVREPQMLAPSDSKKRITPIAVKDQKGQALIFGGEELKFDEVISNTGNGTQGGMANSYPTKLKPAKIFKPATLEPLTERENRLKQILMRSQLFLDTAEALLKLNISFVILNANDHDCLDEDDKLILDCGYELMKRKGTRQEIRMHPYVKISITSAKIISLDDLVKQLDNDFELLKLYGKNGRKDCKPEEYLPKMLESDVHDRYPDMNCMWDASWDANMLAFLEKDDVTREVERQVFNGLISEICLDLLHI